MFEAMQCHHNILCFKILTNSVKIWGITLSIWTTSRSTSRKSCTSSVFTGSWRKRGDIGFLFKLFKPSKVKQSGYDVKEVVTARFKLTFSSVLSKKLFCFRVFFKCPFPSLTWSFFWILCRIGLRQLGQTTWN